MAKLVKQGTGFAVFVPLRCMEELGWLPGDELAIRVHNKTLEVKSDHEHTVTIRRKGERPRLTW